MKCIKLIKQTKGRELGEVMRTTDHDAGIRVKGGNWAYAPKSDWKEYRGKTKKTDQVNDQVTDQVPTKRGKRSDKK